jgi:hypothetical protein
MSVHVGWPDLSDARRRSLCVIIDELKASMRNLDLLEACLIEQGKTLPDSLMTIHAARYQEILDLTELQFPEIRIERDVESHGLQRTNQGLRRGMALVDQSLARAIGCTVSELMHFYRHGTLLGSLAKPAESKAKKVAK